MSNTVPIKKKLKVEQHAPLLFLVFFFKGDRGVHLFVFFFKGGRVAQFLFFFNGDRVAHLLVFFLKGTALLIF
jgi:hypothetical protein